MLHAVAIFSRACMRSTLTAVATADAEAVITRCKVFRVFDANYCETIASAAVAVVIISSGGTRDGSPGRQ